MIDPPHLNQNFFNNFLDRLIESRLKLKKITEGVVSMNNRDELDIMKYYYQNCTVVKGNVIFQSIDKNYDLDRVVEHIEDIWGYLAIDGLKVIRRIVFENLRIIRGQQKKEVLGHRSNIAIQISRKWFSRN